MENFLHPFFSDPPEVSAAERTVYSGPHGKADLTCIVKAQPKANVSRNNHYLSIPSCSTSEFQSAFKCW